MASEADEDRKSICERYSKSSMENYCGNRLLFEMQITGFFNDLPPTDSEDCRENSCIASNHQRRPIENKVEGWSLSHMLGFSSSSSKNKTLLPPIWTLRLIQWQVALSPDMRAVVAVQSGMLTIHHYNSQRLEGNELDDNKRSGERLLDLPRIFRRCPQSRLLAWCCDSRYLLVFAGSDGNGGSKSSATEDDLLVLDTELGEILGTLNTSALFTSATPAGSGGPACSAGHFRCVGLFCMDLGVPEEVSGPPDSAHLFDVGLVSAAGDVVAVSCSLRPLGCSGGATSFGKGYDESKIQEHRFELACRILAVSGDASNCSSGSLVEVDAVTWLPWHRTVLLAISSMPSGGKYRAQLHVRSIQLKSYERSRWQWLEWCEGMLIDTSPMNICSGSNRTGVSNDEHFCEPVRALSFSSNSSETLVLLLVSSGHLVPFTLQGRGGRRGGEREAGLTLASSDSPLDHDALMRDCRGRRGAEKGGVDDDDAGGKTITGAHFLTEDSVLVVMRDGSVAAWTMTSDAGAGAEAGKWRAQVCDVDALPPALGLCASHSAVVPAAPTAGSEGGVLSRIAVLRAVDSWSCQIFTMTCITGMRSVQKKTHDLQFDQALELIDRLGLGAGVKDEVLVAQWQRLFIDTLVPKQSPSASTVNVLLSRWRAIESPELAMKCLLDVVPRVAQSSQGCRIVLATLPALLWQGFDKTESIAKLVLENLDDRTADEIAIWLDSEKLLGLLKMRATVANLLKRLIVFQFLLQSELEGKGSSTDTEVDFFLRQDFVKFCDNRHWAVPMSKEDIGVSFCMLFIRNSTDEMLDWVVAWLAGTGRVSTVTVMLGCFPERFLRSADVYLARVLDQLPLGLDAQAYRHLLPVLPPPKHDLSTLYSSTVEGTNSGEFDLVPISQWYQKTHGMGDEMCSWVEILQSDVVTCPVVVLTLFGLSTTMQTASPCESDLDVVLSWYLRRIWDMERFGQSSTAAALSRLAVQGLEACSTKDLYVSFNPRQIVQVAMLRELSTQLGHFCALLYGLSGDRGVRSGTWREDGEVGDCRVELLPPMTCFVEWVVQPLSARIEDLVAHTISWLEKQKCAEAKYLSFLDVFQQRILPLLFGPTRLFGSFSNAFSSTSSSPEYVATFIAMVMGMGFVSSDLNFVPFDWESWSGEVSKADYPPVVRDLVTQVGVGPTLKPSTLELVAATAGCLTGEGEWNRSSLESIIVAALASAVSESGAEVADRALACALQVAKQSAPTRPAAERVLSDSAHLGHLVLLACRAYNTVTVSGMALMWELLETTPVHFTDTNPDQHDNAIFSLQARQDLKQQLDLLQTALSLSEIVSQYNLVHPVLIAATSSKGSSKPPPRLTLSMLSPCSALDKFERRKFTQVLLQGTGHFVAGLDYLQKSPGGNMEDAFSCIETTVGHTTFEQALILHCCAQFLETSTTISYVGSSNSRDSSHPQRIVASSLLNFVAGRVSRVSTRLKQVKQSIVPEKDENSRVKEHRHALDKRAEQWARLCDDLLVIVKFMSTLATDGPQVIAAESGLAPSPALSKKWTGQVVFQAMLQCALATVSTLAAIKNNEAVSEKEFFSRLCREICAPKVATTLISSPSSAIQALGALFREEFSLSRTEIIVCLKMRAEAAFNGASSCTLCLPGYSGETYMEGGLREATFLCDTAYRIITGPSAQDGRRGVKDSCEEVFSEELHLLSMVNFVRHLDELVESRRNVSTTQSAIDSSAGNKEVIEPLEGSGDYHGEGLDFVPFQLRHLGPVEVARRVLQHCPRAYRTSYVHTWSFKNSREIEMTTSRDDEDDEGVIGGDDDDDDGSIDDDADDEPLRGLLARQVDPASVRREREDAARCAFMADESSKLFPIRGSKKTTSVYTEDVNGLSSHGESLLQDDNEDDDALLQQYYRSQTTLGSMFVHLMRHLPAPRLREGKVVSSPPPRALETAIYAEAIKAAVSAGELSDAVELAEVVIKKQHDEDTKERVIGNATAGSECVTASSSLVIDAVSGVLGMLDDINGAGLRQRLSSLLLCYAPDANLAQVCQLYHTNPSAGKSCRQSEVNKGVNIVSDDEYAHLARVALGGSIRNVIFSCGGMHAVPICMSYHEDDSTSITPVQPVKSLMADITGGGSSFALSSKSGQFSAGVVMDCMGYLMMMRDSDAVKSLLDDMLIDLKMRIAAVISHTQKSSTSSFSTGVPASLTNILTVPCEELITQIEHMGFSRHGARRAVISTKNAPMEVALRWAIKHSLDKDFDEPIITSANQHGKSASAKEAQGSGCILPESMLRRRVSDQDRNIQSYTSTVSSVFSGSVEHLQDVGLGVGPEPELSVSLEALNKAVELVRVVSECYAAAKGGRTDDSSLLISAPDGRPDRVPIEESTPSLLLENFEIKEADEPVDALVEKWVAGIIAGSDMKVVQQAQSARVITKANEVADDIPSQQELEGWVDDDELFNIGDSSSEEDVLDVGDFGSDDNEENVSMKNEAAENEVVEEINDVMAQDIVASQVLKLEKVDVDQVTDKLSRQSDSEREPVEKKHDVVTLSLGIDISVKSSAAVDDDDVGIEEGDDGVGDQPRSNTCIDEDGLLADESTPETAEQTAAHHHAMKNVISASVSIIDIEAEATLDVEVKESPSHCVPTVDTTISLPPNPVNSASDALPVITSEEVAGATSSRGVSSTSILSHLSEVSSSISRLEAALSLAVMETAVISDTLVSPGGGIGDDDDDSSCKSFIVSVDLASHVDAGQLAREIVFTYNEDPATQQDNVARKAEAVDAVVQVLLALALHSNPLCFNTQLSAVMGALPPPLLSSVTEQVRCIVLPPLDQQSSGYIGENHYTPTVGVATFFSQLATLMSTNSPSVFDENLEVTNGGATKLLDCDILCHLSMVHLAGRFLMSINHPEASSCFLSSSNDTTSAGGPFHYLKPLSKHPLRLLQVLRAAYQLVPSGCSTCSLSRSFPLPVVHSHLPLIEYLKRSLVEMLSGSLSLEPTPSEPSVTAVSRQALSKQVLEEVATLRRVGRIPGADSVNLKLLLLSDDVLPVSALIGVGTHEAKRSDRVMCAVVEVARFITANNAQQWHRAVGRIYDIGQSELYLHCLVTRLFQLREEMFELESSAICSDIANGSTSAEWQRQALIEEFAKTHESVLLKMLPTHVKIITLMIASLSLPPPSAATASAPSLLLSTLHALSNKVPPSILEYSRRQHEIWGRREGTASAPPHDLYIGLSSPAMTQLLSSIRKMKFKEPSKAKSGSAASSEQLTMMETADWINVLLKYCKVVDCLPCGFSSGEAAVNMYCHGIYSVDALQELLVHCCLSPMLPSSTVASSTAISLAPETAKFQAMVSCLQNLRGLSGVDDKGSFCLDWDLVIEQVAHSAVHTLVSKALPWACNTGQEVLRVLDDDSVNVTKSRHRQILVDNFDKCSLFSDAWILFEKLTVLCAGASGAKAGSADLVFPDNIKHAITSSVKTYVDENLTDNTCCVFVSLAVITKALSLFVGPEDAASYRSEITFTYCLTNAFVHAPDNATSLSLSTETVTSAVLGPVPWAAFDDVREGNCVALEAWLQQLFMRALSRSTVNQDEVETAQQVRAVLAVQRLLRTLGLSSTAGQPPRLAQAWRAVTFRGVEAAPRLLQSDEATASTQALSVVAMANRCWRRVLGVLAASSRASESMEGSGRCVFARFFVEVLLVDYHHSSLTSDDLSLAPGGVLLHFTPEIAKSPPLSSRWIEMEPLDEEIVQIANASLPGFFSALVELVAVSLEPQSVASREAASACVQRVQAARLAPDSHSDDSLLVMLLLLLGVPVHHFARHASLYDLVVRTSLNWFHCRVKRAVTDCEEGVVGANSSEGVLQQYVAVLAHCRDVSTEMSVLLPYALSPLRLALCLASCRLFGQASQLLFSLLGLPVAMFSSRLARQQLDWHIASGRLPLALSRLEETSTSSGVGIAARQQSAYWLGWEMHARMCRQCVGDGGDVIGAPLVT